MADQTATVSIQKIVKRFVFKYKINEDDFANYLEHAIDCFRDLNISHLSYLSQANLTLDSVGKVSFPADMIDFVALGEVKDDVFYTFMQSTDLNVPTTAVSAATGDWNKYFYYLDWVNRYIYCQTLSLETVTLRYISSGISTTAETFVPIQTTQVIDAYLRWMESLMNGSNSWEQNTREANYDKAILRLRYQQLPTLEQFKDTWLGVAYDDQSIIGTSTLGSTSTSTGDGDMNSYNITVDLVAGSNTVTTGITTEPYAITLWDNTDTLIPNNAVTISTSVVGGVYVLTIYTVDDIPGVEIRIAY